MKKNFTFFSLITMSVLQLAFASPAFCQNPDRTISGVIVDATSGDPVIGAYLSSVPKDRNGVITDIDGNFTLTIPQGTKDETIFTAVCVGYNDLEITLKELSASGKLRMEVKSELLPDFVIASP